MEEATKSAIFQMLTDAFEKRQNFEKEFLIKKTGQTVKVVMIFGERESFVDKDGVKWVRA
jgi:hypothetical protein